MRQHLQFVMQMMCNVSNYYTFVFVVTPVSFITDFEVFCLAVVYGCSILGYYDKKLILWV